MARSSPDSTTAIPRFRGSGSGGKFVPGRFVVEVTECEKVSCPRCRDAVVTAPAPAKVIPGGQLGPGVLARMIVDEAEDHLPLTPAAALAREGWTVPTNYARGVVDPRPRPAPGAARAAARGGLHGGAAAD
ncbi:MAG: uncharacterized protein JWM10_2337 [Myxococcaceae bacterium]|nr:uncharacterized protein [Myxococcaceae bacterium]